MKDDCEIEIIYLLHRNYGRFSNAIYFFESLNFNSLKKKFNIQFVCLMKGWSISEVESVCCDSFRVVHVPNVGRDIYSYYHYAKYKTQSKFLFFFNTSSKILSEEFINTALLNLSLNKISILGATGSFAAPINSYYFETINTKQYSATDILLNCFKKMVSRFVELIFKFMGIIFIPHLRTNAFSIRRDLFLKSFEYFKIGNPPKLKIFSLLYESSARGLTGYIKSIGGDILVVDKNGHLFESNKWIYSATYCSFGQVNLGVSDNRTTEYELASLPKKHKLYMGAWCKTFNVLSDENIRKKESL